MEIRFDDEDLDRLETDPSFSAGLPPEIVKAFRKAVNYIRQAVDERDIRARKAFHFEKLKGERSGEYSLRLNLQWRLIAELEGEAPSKTFVVCGVEKHYED
jgi:proteic killer suppression protein